MGRTNRIGDVMQMRRLTFVAIAAMATLALTVGVALAVVPTPPFTANADCLACHDVTQGGPAFTKVAFDVGAVDRNTACAKCHWEPAGAHPFHNPAMNCGACHGGWGTPNGVRVPRVSTSAGWFYEAASANASASELHAVHLNPRWPASITGPASALLDGDATPRQCASCHAAAACDACHSSPVGHGDAANTLPTASHTAMADPWTGVTGYGTPAGNETANSAALRAVNCSASGCHSHDAFDPGERIEDGDPRITFTGSWSTFWGSQYSGGRSTYATSDGTASMSVTGPKTVTWIGVRDSFSGIAKVLVDGVEVATVDCYSPTTEYRAFMYTATLPAGTHTFAVRATGTKNPSSMNNLVYVDAFDIKAPAGPFVPTCLSCHPTRTNAHGYENVDHEADQALATGPDTAGKTCGSCHAMALLDEHERATSASAGDSCGTCHPTPRDQFGAWDQTCAQCHSGAAGSAPLRHAEDTAGHTLPASAALCSECHEGLLPAVHSGAVSKTDATKTSCNVCHTTTAYPATKDCASCHAVFGEHKFAGAVETKHTSSWSLAGCIDSGCHASNALWTEHSSRTPSGGGAFQCVTCHDNGGADSARYKAAIAANNTACDACHDGVTQTASHVDQHPAVPPLVDAAGTPYYSYVNRLTGLPRGPATADCAGCHSSNLVYEHLGNGARPGRTDSSGQTLSCGTCHDAPAGSTVSNAIVAGDTNCGACHTVHDEMSFQHTSTYKDSPETDCSTCHSANLSTVHAGMSVSPNGRELTGCELCHGYYEGARGQQIQYAIEVANDTKCTACHSAYHGDASTKHRATSTASVTGCGGCHDNVVDNAIDAPTVHSGVASPGPCTVCHNNPARVPDIKTKTAECASCHATTGTDYHRQQAVKHTYAGGTSCVSAGCHASNTLPEAHEPYLARYPQYADTCALCHQNSDPARIDWNTATADCSTCHTVHGDINVIHQAPDSQDCAECHETVDVRTIHATSADPQTSCARCHNATVVLPASTKCVNCHTAYHGGAPAKHSATSSASVTGCGRCHDNVVSGAIDVSTQHAGVTNPGPCTVCHKNPVRVPNIKTKTAECASCHATTGTDYHRQQTTKHTYAGGTSCVAAGCHASNKLPEAHQPYLSRYPQYADTCALCHLNTSPTRIDWNTASADCSTCHTVHGDINVIHQAPNSQACVDCHETADVRTIHATSADPQTSCARCHDGRVLPADTQCVKCHSSRSPVDPNHYNATKHTATEPGDCASCHYLDMKAEHFRSSTQPAVSCVSCHELKVDNFTAAWNKTCGTCHSAKHTERATKHVSTRTDCGGSGCHPIADVSDIHDGTPISSSGTLPTAGCSFCHSQTKMPTSTNCGTSGCHPGLTGGHHEQHNATTFIPAGCSGCHFTYLDDEHLALGLECQTCHASTARQDVKNAIAQRNRACVACHPSNHYDGAGKYYEFNPSNASGHRVTSDLSGMRSSFVVGGKTYSWSLPSASSFLKSGWTTTSIVKCSDCHSYSGATGPHGAQMKVNIDPNYTRAFSTGLLQKSGIGMQSDLLCAKCHVLMTGSSNWSNVVHKEHDDRGMTEGGRCVSCHVSIPHGWARPRMLGSTQDPAPYATVSGGLIEFALKSYTPNSWQKSDCYAGCSSNRHPDQSNPWPGTAPMPPDTGTLSGRVTNSSGTGISGATVSVSGGPSTTTNSTGNYTLTVNVGSYTVTASAVGYTSQSKSATITKNQTTTLNFSMATAPVTTGTITGTVTNASNGAAVSGAAVSLSNGASTTTASNGTYTLSNVTAGTYTMTVTANGFQQWSGLVTVTAGQTTTRNVALTPGSANLALGKTFTASRYESSTYSPSKAGDDSTSTYWWSDREGGRYDREWLQVDLGARYRLRKVEIVWYGQNFARDFRIYTSNDGSSWTTVREENDNRSGGTYTYTFDREARYVRVECRRTYDDRRTGYAIAELRAFQ